MENISRLYRALRRLYSGIGIAAMGGVALLVIITVIARYFFSLSWMGLDEFMNVLFAFTTFWGMGLAVLEGEHVMIDIIYQKIHPGPRRWVALLNLAVTLMVVIVVGVYSVVYIRQVGMHPSPGMGVKMQYLYGIMPVSFLLCAACVVIKSIPLLLGRPQNDDSGAAQGGEG